MLKMIVDILSLFFSAVPINTPSRTLSKSSWFHHVLLLARGNFTLSLAGWVFRLASEKSLWWPQGETDAEWSPVHSIQINVN